MACTVRPVTTAADRKRFNQIQREIYKHDPNWVPPIWQVQDELVGFRKHPFYERNACQAFIAVDGDRPVGRIVAIHNVGHVERYNDDVGFFGFFECIDDESVAQTLVSAACEWLRERGLKTLRGPSIQVLTMTAAC